MSLYDPLYNSSLHYLQVQLGIRKRRRSIWLDFDETTPAMLYWTCLLFVTALLSTCTPGCLGLGNLECAMMDFMRSFLVHHLIGVSLYASFCIHVYLVLPFLFLSFSVLHDSATMQSFNTTFA